MSSTNTGRGPRNPQNPVPRRTTGPTANPNIELPSTLPSWQSRAKDIEQRLAAAIIQEQQMLHTRSTAGSSSSSSSRRASGKSNPPSAQQQQQQQQMSKNINRYRTILCETYADWILSSPATAVVNDVMNALWRSCFYGRIGPARVRLQKDQKKLLSSSAANHHHQSALDRAVQEQRESLDLFLKEGITLYEYLCQNLQQHLVEQQLQQQQRPRNRSMNQDESHDFEKVDTSSSNNGIVPCLYRLYISLGDLYRYGGDANHSSTLAAYHTALRLGPAYGHAYNQLAVTYQTKDTTTATANTNHQNNTITTVYWYTRSLGAAQEPFVTAASNLMRLFDSNRQWLQQQQEQTKKILLRPGSTSENQARKTNTDDDDDDGTKATSTKVVSTNQVNNSRLCLSNFVDVQYTVYTMAKGEAEAAEAKNPNWNSLENQIRSMMTCIQELLKNSSFSDALLCKLITIMAFMEYHCQAAAASRTPDIRNNLRRLIRIIMYDMGYYMAERVHLTLTTKRHKQQSMSSSTPALPSIRVLLPLLLLTEYLLQNVNLDDDSENYPHHHNDTESERYQEAYALFWQKVIAVYNDILLSLDGTTIETTTPPPTNSPIPEYQELRGFLPFESFLKCGGGGNDDLDTYLTDNGYMSDTATIIMMDTWLDRNGAMTKSHQQQHRTATTQESSSHRMTSQGSFGTNISVSSSTTNNSSNPNSKEARLMKLRRFMALRSDFVSKLPRHVRVHYMSEALEWVEDTSNDELMFNMDSPSMQYMNKKTDKDDMYYGDDDGGDCIVAMMDQNEGTINAIHSLVADENVTLTLTRDQNQKNEPTRTDDILLIYQQNNDGPALLVPGALLSESSERVVTSNNRTTTTAMSHNHLFDDNVIHDVNSTVTEAKLGPTITPPPGFAPTGSNHTNLNVFHHISEYGSSFGGDGLQLYGNPSFHHNNNNNSNNNWYGTTIPHNVTPTIGESMALFGGPSALQTANPFATTSSDSRLLFDTAVVDSTTTRNYMPLYGNENDTALIFGSTTTQSSDDDAVLFHSGFLKSLLLEETTTGGQAPLTKNPFT